MISCKFDMDTACAALKFTDGNIIAVDNKVADNMYERSELDYLIYNALLEYTDLILNRDSETYLKTVTEYKPLDSESTCRLWENPAGGIFMQLQTC